MALPDYFEAIETHLDLFFSDSDEIIFFDEKESPDFHLDVYLIKANNKRNYHILLTNGVSSLPMKTPNDEFTPFVELGILLPNTWDFNFEKLKDPLNYWPISLLKQFGRYPHENGTWLGFGHTIPQPINRPIVGTLFTSTILLKSKTLPLNFQKIKYKKCYIEVYFLFPLFESEQKYKEQYGTNELLNKFQEKGIEDIINIKRMKCI